MSFKCAIIGLPNVGKSTLFNALTASNVSAENYPFCTIEPNIGIVSVPDERLYELAKIVHTKRIIPSTIQFIDIAGLIKGASKGEGLGNKFLSKIQETEVLVHVVRCFESDKIIHIKGKIDPIEDIYVVNTELISFDIELCQRAINQLQKNKIKCEKQKNINIKIKILEKCLFHLNNFEMLRTLNLLDEEKKNIQYINFLTIKPIMYIINTNKNNINNLSHINRVKDFARCENASVILMRVDIKSNEFNFYKKNNNFIEKSDVVTSDLHQIIMVGYDLLNLQTYFTAGLKEVHAWTIPIGSTAQQAAKKIHTDFFKGFIRAQIISYIDFIRYKGMQKAKEAGKMHYEGKNYLLKKGDVVNFLFKV